MLQPSSFRPTAARRPAQRSHCWLAALLWLCITGVTAHAQSGFVSGSTGADGAFNPTQSQTLQLPESGVFNFSTVNIPAGVTIRFGRNSRNTPVIILATGNMTIAGTLDVSGLNGGQPFGGQGGPGGFNGGTGGPATRVSGTFSLGGNGDGPGGGSGSGSASSPTLFGAGGGGGFANPGIPGSWNSEPTVNGAGGPRYGLPTLLPLIGGSGGGGEGGFSSSGAGAGGGGGGGALLLASSSVINFGDDPFTVRIAANGGNGFSANVGAGGGSGGAVRLMANTISGALRVNAGGGGNNSFGGGAAAATCGLRHST